MTNAITDASISCHFNDDFVLYQFSRLARLVEHSSLYTQEVFVNEFNKTNTKLEELMEKIKVDGVTYTVNFGMPFQYLSEALLLKHYAPDSCEGCEDPLSRFNKIDPNNQLINASSKWCFLAH